MGRRISYSRVVVIQIVTSSVKVWTLPPACVNELSKNVGDVGDLKIPQNFFLKISVVKILSQ